MFDFVHSIAVVSRSGRLLFNAIFRLDETTREVDVLNIQMHAHGALDLLNDLKAKALMQYKTVGTTKANKTAPPPQNIKGMYAGLLSSVGNLATYGFCTNNQMSIVVTTLDNNQSVTDAKMVEVMHTIQSFIVKTTSNPFYISDTPLSSPNFLAQITDAFSKPTLL